ncbi:MAG: phosphoribosylamine--glycine ligase, partial [Myxococcota bacterium]|nr:phosphoribosylamine--glycine ligase [Myxococcota bacterium]
ESSDILEGLLPRSFDWQSDLSWVGGASDRGLILFEGTGQGATQDALRRDGYRVVGGSALGDRLELDRAFGQTVLREVGMQTAPTHEFESFDDAIAFVARTRRRYVLKYNGSGFSSMRNYVGVLEDGSDMLATLRIQRARWPCQEPPSFVLMNHVSGVEVGVGALFNGQDFLSPPNIDWEHKRFFPGDLGELTGEMGTLVSYSGAKPLFDASLARVAGLFREAKHVGYVNLNMIVNADGIWPLEFTCRFGYPGFAILSALHAEPWDAILNRVVDGGTTFQTQDGFAVGVVLTVPPFPYFEGFDRLSKGAAICFHPDLTDEDRDALHYGEVRIEAGQLVTAGQVGYVMVVTGRGSTAEEARSVAYSRARKVVVPNVRYRTDIGEKFERHDHAELVRLGWLS